MAEPALPAGSVSRELASSCRQEATAQAAACSLTALWPGAGPQASFPGAGAVTHHRASPRGLPYGGPAVTGSLGATRGEAVCSQRARLRPSDRQAGRLLRTACGRDNGGNIFIALTMSGTLIPGVTHRQPVSEPEIQRGRPH